MRCPHPAKIPASGVWKGLQSALTGCSGRQTAPWRPGSTTPAQLPPWLPLCCCSAGRNSARPCCVWPSLPPAPCTGGFGRPAPTAPAACAPQTPQRSTRGNTAAESTGSAPAARAGFCPTAALANPAAETPAGHWHRNPAQSPRSRRRGFQSRWQRRIGCESPHPGSSPPCIRCARLPPCAGAAGH